MFSRSIHYFTLHQFFYSIQTRHIRTSLPLYILYCHTQRGIYDPQCTVCRIRQKYLRQQSPSTQDSSKNSKNPPNQASFWVEDKISGRFFFHDLFSKRRSESRLLCYHELSSIRGTIRDIYGILECLYGCRTHISLHHE